MYSLKPGGVLPLPPPLLISTAKCIKHLSRLGPEWMLRNSQKRLTDLPQADIDASRRVDNSRRVENGVKDVPIEGVIARRT